MRRSPARSRCWRKLTSWCWGWSVPPQCSPRSCFHSDWHLLTETVAARLHLTSPQSCTGQSVHTLAIVWDFKRILDTTITQSCFQLEGQSQWSEQNFQDQSGQQETKLDEGSLGTNCQTKKNQEDCNWQSVTSNFFASELVSRYSKMNWVIYADYDMNTYDPWIYTSWSSFWLT